MKKQIKIAVLILLMITFISGCGNNNSTIKENYIYYLNNDMSSLKKVDYHIESANVYQVVSELITEMEIDSVENDYFSAKPKDLEIPEFEINDKILTLYFDNTYYDMSNTEEILFRAALVLTMVQLEEISYVSMYVGEQPLIDSNGLPVGNMSKSSFVDISGTMNELDQKINLTIYYPNQKGDMVYSNPYEGRIDSNTSFEELVLQKLSGKAFTSDTQVNSVMIRNRICYVDFSNDFILEYIGIEDEVAIYSIVNSLCELPKVSGVVISVDGSSEIKFHENIDLDTIFHTNLDIVE